jgi:hypothetical protein
MTGSLRWSASLFVAATAVTLGLMTQTPNVATSADKDKEEAKPTGKKNDIEMVEKLIAARKQYQSSLEQLRAYYERSNDMERKKWAEDELRQFHRVIKHAYMLELDVPIPTLQPKDNIPEANDLYRRAMTYKEKGFGSDYLDNQRRTEILLQTLLDKYPQSDKIGEVAYQLGDVYEDYRPTPQYRRAAAYFERAFQWNKTGQSDARLRAARLYDKQLSERSRAIELYKEVVSHDTDPNRLREAERRLAELTGKR